MYFSSLYKLFSCSSTLTTCYWSSLLISLGVEFYLPLGRELLRLSSAFYILSSYSYLASRSSTIWMSVTARYFMDSYSCFCSIIISLLPSYSIALRASYSSVRSSTLTLLWALSYSYFFTKSFFIFSIIWLCSVMCLSIFRIASSALLMASSSSFAFFISWYLIC